MNMKKVIFMIISAVLTLLYGCEKENGVNYVAVSVIVEYPADLISPQVVSEIFEFRNITTGNVTSYDRRDGILLPAGLYDCSYTAEVKHLFGSDTLTASVQGMTRSVQLSPASSKVTVSSFVLEDKGDFIIQEVFYTGTLYPTGKQYNGTGYVRIYNNTDRVLYADGLAFMESKFSTTQKFDYTPDLLSSHMTVHAIYVIPGSGQEHPVAPGESLILCDTGIDHRLVNPNAFDLSHADFEWYDVSSSPSNLDIDSPTVPNLDKWYCYTKSFFILHNRGFKAWALARIPTDKETFLAENYYEYEYTMVLPAGTFPMSQKAYKVPNEWIVDAVNASVASEYVWNVTDASLDRGYTYCGEIDHDKTRYFKSVRRKLLYKTSDGRCVLKDTNNSTVDFNAGCVPSLIEEQHTAVDANGTPAVTVTYDGVTPVEE